MIKQNQTKFNIIHIVNDAVCCILSIIIAYFISVHAFHNDVIADLKPSEETAVIAVFTVILIQLISNLIFDLYRSYRTSRFVIEAVNIVKSALAVFVVLLLISFSASVLYFFQIPIALYFFAYCITAMCYRIILRNMLKFFRSKGYNKKYIIFIGINDCTDTVLKKIRSSPDLGYEISGYFDVAPHSKSELNYLGSLKDLSGYLKKFHPDEGIIMLSDKTQSYTTHIISICENWGLKFSIIPNIFSEFSSRIFISSFDGIPVLSLRKVPLDNKFNSFIKRTMDIIISLIMLICASPIMLVTAIIIKATSPGNVIFKQKRIGLGRKEFIMYKFRSMRTETEKDISMAEENDSRCTKFGRFIRKTSIDELPQLINVLKGNMSLVGPRPEIPYYVEEFRKSVPQYMIKHYVKPGMTGWAQVNDLRGGDTSIEKRIEYDVYYIEHWTPLFDIKILFRTIWKCFFSKSAR